jgi:tetratricopeptide (TPR) repeat protein
VDLDEDARAALESLGYATTRVTRAGVELPDPRRMLRIQRLINAATESINGERYEEARRALQLALSHDPHNKEVHEMFGRLHARLGQPERAIEYFTRCLELPPETADQSARTGLANAYLRLERFDEAERQYELVLEATPEDPDAWYNLGILRVTQGRTAEAEAAWREVLRLDPRHAGARDALRRIDAPLPKDD